MFDNLILKSFTKVVKRLEKLQDKNSQRVEQNAGKLHQLKDQMSTVEKESNNLLEENQRVGRVIERIQDLME